MSVKLVVGTEAVYSVSLVNSVPFFALDRRLFFIIRAVSRSDSRVSISASFVSSKSRFLSSDSLFPFGILNGLFNFGCKLTAATGP